MFIAGSPLLVKKSGFFLVLVANWEASYVSTELGAISFFLYHLYRIIFSFLAITSAVKIKETKEISLDESKSET
ncbi:MAG: hypothetical protein ACP5LC_04855 [Thermoplasmata archaeon]